MSIRFSLRAPSGQTTVITGPFRIGRDAECEIRVDNGLVSRIHASIWIDHDHLLLRDERSRNGTLLNGETLKPGEAQYLHHGDEVRIGDVPFIVESDPPYPRPRQHSGLVDEEPPPTARLDKRSVPAAASAAAPAASPPLAPAPAAASRSRTVPLVIGGCAVLALLAACCLLGLFAATSGGPIISTALAPLRHLTATPIPY